jgi:hypothetical protein
MADLSRDDLTRFARLGARARLEELRREEAAIRAAFPELFRKASAPSTPRKRSRMSAAARKTVSERMTKYWAARRKAKAAGRK